MLKQDFKKIHRDLYPAKPRPMLVDVPARSFLMIDGHGDPDRRPEYVEAVEALYAVSYAIRFALKHAEVVEYPVLPLEGLWWTEEFSDTPEHLRRDEWIWTIMIPQPPQATAEIVSEALATARRKKGDRPGLARLRFEEFAEGLSAQMLHVGPFSAEPETMDILNRFVAEQGKRITGKHHEIYLSDLRKTEPAKLRTVLRHGVGLA